MYLPDDDVNFPLASHTMIMLHLLGLPCRVIPDCGGHAHLTVF
jgi:hypothetical protein